jgi:hypothetical protein
VPVPLGELKAGDIFRMFEADGTPDFVVDGVPQTCVALADAKPTLDIADEGLLTWGVQGMSVRGFEA